VCVKRARCARRRAGRTFLEGLTPIGLRAAGPEVRGGRGLWRPCRARERGSKMKRRGGRNSSWRYGAAARSRAFIPPSSGLADMWLPARAALGNFHCCSTSSHWARRSMRSASWGGTKCEMISIFSLSWLCSCASRRGGSVGGGGGRERERAKHGYWHIPARGLPNMQVVRSRALNRVYFASAGMDF